MSVIATPDSSRPTRVRYLIVLVLFLVTSLNYADRATLSMVGSDLSKEFSLDPLVMGYLLSAFSWAYAAAQIPGGWLLDRLGSKRVYCWSIALWSCFTLLQAFIFGQGTQFTVPTLFAAPITVSGAVLMLFGLRLMLGVAEAPAFPANSRIVASWFPTAERGTASAIFNSAQYGGTVIFSPIMGWLTHAYGWQPVFWFMGGLGMLFAAAWTKLIYAPKQHPLANAAEVAHIERGGGLVNLDQAGSQPKRRPGLVVELLKNRMLMGIFTAQYCINVLTWFFLTWFPIYLVKERGMTILKVGFVATLPALCGFIGGVLGGWISDRLLRRGAGLTIARKTPIVAGLLLSTSIVVCNYVETQWAVIVFMSLSFFGKGVGALGWAVMSDVAPREATGLASGVFNTFGNLAGIITPIVIGYILKMTGSFNGALIYVGAHGALAVACYLLIVGKIERVELRSS